MAARSEISQTDPRALPRRAAHRHALREAHGPRRPRALRRRVAAPRALLLVAAALSPLLAPAVQAAPPATLGDAVASWARGTWASPVYCRIDGETVRGIRRVLIQPSKDVAPGQTVVTVQFVDMQVDDAERCFDLVGNDLPNLIGKLQLRFNGTSHSEMIQRDFERAIKKDRGFAFTIVGGGLRVTPVGPSAGETTQASFRGGEAWLREPARASDPERALADFDSPRKLELEVVAPDGMRQVLPLFLLEVR